MRSYLFRTLMTVAFCGLIASVAALPALAQGTLYVEGTSVGIQDANPSTTLHIRETDSAKANRTIVRISGSDFYPQFEYENEATGKKWRLGVNSSNQFVFNETADLGVAEMLITPDGHVFVNGTQVHPDYVFAPSYKLMPLEQLNSYIKENRHLPEVVTAEQRKKQGGIDLSSFPAELLKKVEELTLYTIQQDQQIKDLQKTNGELLKRLDRLEKAERAD